jgi:hypothetical protein
MTDNQLIALMASRLDAAMTTSGWGYVVVQKEPPNQQGIPSAPTVFFEKLFDHPYGHPMIQNILDVPNMKINEKNTQLYETTFQISAMVIQNPSDLSIPTASDVANYVKMFMALGSTRNLFMAQGVGMLRVTEVRNPYFQDDHSQLEANPSFDVVFTHNRTMDDIVPATNIVTGNAYVVP